MHPAAEVLMDDRPAGAPMRDVLRCFRRRRDSDDVSVRFVVAIFMHSPNASQ